MHESPVVWRLKKGMDRRFRGGHPWVFSNEVQSLDGLKSNGAPVTLVDPGGAFLAHGYGNKNSLIAFRSITREESAVEWMTEAGLIRILKQARSLREVLGLTQASYRWIHGEGDDFPGLIVENYLLTTGKRVAVIQCHTAGADRLKELLPSAIRAVDASVSEIVFRNDVRHRELEGLESRVDCPDSLGAVNEIVVSSPSGGTETFRVSFCEGQKTGFFLDQAENVAELIRRLSSMNWNGKKVRILDICCYVGQWSTHLSRFLKSRGATVECTLMDLSAQALEFASKNVQGAGGVAISKKSDVLKELETLTDKNFDIVICDPPALIQNRKSIPQGVRAYQKLNREALRAARPGGWFVSSSCSQLLDEATFLESLAYAEKNAGRPISWIASGQQSADHPLKSGFPEGKYLKMKMGWIQNSGEKNG